MNVDFNEGYRKAEDSIRPPPARTSDRLFEHPIRAETRSRGPNVSLYQPVCRSISRFGVLGVGSGCDQSLHVWKTKIRGERQVELD